MNSVEIGDRHRKQLKANILKLFDDFIKETKIEDLEKLDVNLLLDKLYVRLRTFEKEVDSSSYSQLREIVLKESGDNIVNVFPTGSFMSKYRFDMLNETTLNSYRRYKIKSENDFVYGTVKAVERALQRALRRGKSNREIFETFEDTFGLTEQQEQAYDNYVSALKSGSKRSLSYENRDKEKDSLVSSAIATGIILSASQIDRLAKAYLKRCKEYRASVIADTDAGILASLGEYESILQAGEKGALDISRVLKHWITAGDERVRVSHQMIPLMNSDGVQFFDVFITPDGPLRFPRDPLGLPQNIINCRCYLEYSIGDKT
ncbi:MAG: hypothetical protein NC124_02385 [Clostridium sp.]|nr:hypothetical protein [Clostridium sp.]